LETVYFEWLHWPQASVPFSESELEYIEGLDYKSDVALLNRELPMLRVQSLRLLEVSTTLLKRCALCGLSLAEIGQVMSRPLAGFDDEPSELERLCILAKEEVVFNTSINTKRVSLRTQHEEGEEAEEDFLFVMDDILSGSSTPCSSPDSPASDYGGVSDYGAPGESPVSPLKLHLQLNTSKAKGGYHQQQEEEEEEEDAGRGSGSSTPRYITRRHSSRPCGNVPLGAMSVTHGADQLMRAKPVNCDMPSSELKGLFSDMSSSEWHLFTQILFDLVERALPSWKTTEPRVPCALGTSCPV